MNSAADNQLSRKAIRQARSRKRIKVQFKAPQLRRVLTMAVASGLMATTALPSYGYDPEITALTGLARDHSVKAPALQELSIALGEDVEFTRGEFTPADASDFEVTIRRNRVYTGPTFEDYLAKPRFTTVTSANVMKAAAELVGVPYVFGGETPLGFDCSGYVMFIYSQFGVALPHSVYQQAKLAKKIKLEDAVPGDIVVFNDYSHNGIYAGNGNFYHAPQPGDRVKLAPIFTQRYHIVRFVDIVD
ncbi:MAG: NlpC/P60 family protein [Actinobacteria bacterium]|nr:NlpC/P60 family protein [Actinomycetota bacterium]